MQLNKLWPYFWEFISIFVAVVFAFALTNWAQKQDSNTASTKILQELSNGLHKDLEDMETNIMGHEFGMKSCEYWNNYFRGGTDVIMPTDTTEKIQMIRMYFNLTRDFFTLQNTSAYDALKAKGLEFIEDDSLRFNIINLYEFDYQILHELEEEYYEAQFQQNYFKAINNEIAPYLIFNNEGDVVGLKPNNSLTPAERNILLSYLWKIKTNRRFTKQFYDTVKENIQNLQMQIDDALVKLEGS